MFLEPIDNVIEENEKVVYDNEQCTLFVEDDIEEKESNNVRELHLRYAGTGKTYEILNKLIPTLEEEKIEYIVLTPSHASLKEYRADGINSDVIQSYTLKHTVPTEKCIIIDEIGMVDAAGHDLICKLKKMNKMIYAYGDHQQLPPFGVANKYNTDHYNNYIFTAVVNDKFKNMRNTFTQKYYDKIINEEIDYVVAVREHSTKKPYQAEMILAHRKVIRDTYNEKMLEYLGKDKHDIGVKYICKTNKYRSDDENCMYNGKRLIIKTVDGNNITFDDDNVITKKSLESHFNLGYALDLYEIQGASIESYYWCEEDDKFLNGNMAYVIISRLKTK